MTQYTDYKRQKMENLLVTVCTNRKTVPSWQRIKAQDLPLGPQEYLAKLWCDWLRDADDKMPAKDLYAGRGFSEALATAHHVGADLWVISAGLGLVHGVEDVPAYDLTLSIRSDNSIQNKIMGGPFNAAQWWSDLGRRRRPKRSLANLVKSKPAARIVVSLPGSYLELILDDLLSLPFSDLNRVRIVGPLDTSAVHERLRPCVMPYDDRFNGPETPLAGTRADFSQRAARHFLEHMCVDTSSNDVNEDAARVREFLKGMAWPENAVRKQLGDDEIVKLILSCWDRSEGQSSKMLRVLRDEEGVACEQGRFQDLFKRARRLHFEQQPADTTVRLRAIRSRQGNGIDVYSFFIPGEKITQIADITRIHRTGEDHLVGFQRDEIKQHVKGIIDYLDSGEVLFPNAIILAFSAEVTFTLARGSKPDGALDEGEAGTLSIPLRPQGSRVAWIVDGQQRSLALAKTKKIGLNVPVVAFVAADLETRREQFILVNKAKPLPTRLINELLPDVDTHLPRDLAERKIPSVLCEMLNRDPASPFYGLIKRMSTRTMPEAVVIDSAIIEMIRVSLKNPNGALAPFRSLGRGPSDTEGMYQILVDYWKSVSSVFDTAWGLPPTASRLMHSTGIRAMGVLMDRIVARAIGHAEPLRHIVRSLHRISPHCRWTSGVWEDLGLEWNEIEQTPRHIRQLSQLLCHLDYTAQRDAT